MAQTLSPVETIANFNISELKYLLDKQKEYERIDAILHVLAETTSIASMIFSTLSGIHWEYLSYVALGCSTSTVFFLK